MKITVLIRTHNREKLFHRCIQSVFAQRGLETEIIVHCDNMKNFMYVTQYPVEVHIRPPEDIPFGYNLYCNFLMEKVTDGWFFFLDDDDYIKEPDALFSLSEDLNDENIAVICQYKKRGIRKPTNFRMKQGIIERGKIGLPSIFLHHSQKNIARFEATEDADYRFIKQVSETIRTKFVLKTVVHIEGRGYGL